MATEAMGMAADLNASANAIYEAPSLESDLMSTWINMERNQTFQMHSGNMSFSQSEPMSPTLAAFDSAIRWMDYCFVPIVFSVGAVGNTISFLVFVFSHVRRLSSSVYLAALAISDTGFLLCVFVSWANNIGIHWFHQPGWCQTFVYFTYIFSFLSVWYIVAFTVERYIAVCMPFQRQSMCTSKRAKIVVLALLGLALLLYNFAIWTCKVQMFGETPMCAPLPQYFKMATWITSIDSIFTLVIPCGIILVLNVRIVYVVIFITKQLRTAHPNAKCHGGLSHQSSSGSKGSKGPKGSKGSGQGSKVPGQGIKSNVLVTSSSRNSNTQTETMAHRQSLAQVKVTKMLVIVSTTFLVLNLPSHVIRVYGLLMHFYAHDYRPSRICLILQRFFMYIYYTNFSINFFLYAICGRNFRHALFHSIRKVQYNIRKCASRQRHVPSVALLLPNEVNGVQKRVIREVKLNDEVGMQQTQQNEKSKEGKDSSSSRKSSSNRKYNSRSKSPSKGFSFKSEDNKC